MSDHELSEDISKWPSDPYRLLGVDRKVSSDDLRRAYANLIRRFKPERFPEHFQRIRSAYESIRQFQEHADGSFNFPHTWQSPPPSRPEPQHPVADTTPSESDELSPAARMTESIWNLAITGDREEAYKLLHRQIEYTPRDESIYARMYWLHVLFPELDGKHTPSRWLVIGLKHAEEKVYLFELLRRELCHSPGESTTTRYFELIRTVLPLEWMLAALAWRWEIALRTGNAENVIVKDLADLRSKLQDDPQMCARVLDLAIQHLVWVPGTSARSLVTDCFAELSELVDIYSDGTVNFHLLELLLGISQVWHVMVHGPGRNDPQVQAICETLQIERQVPAYWIANPRHAPSRIDSVMGSLAADPLRALELLDQLLETKSVLAWHIVRVIDQWVDLHFIHDDDPPIPGTREALLDFFVPKLSFEYSRIIYAQFRREVLEFLVNHYISFPRLLDLLRSDHVPQPRGGSLADRLTEDENFRAVASVYHKFWQPLAPGHVRAAAEV